MTDSLTMNKNRVAAALGKAPREFTKADIIAFISDHGIQMVNFMYPAGDGRLKTLNFVVNSLAYLDTILSTGERVDGSSLFSHIEAGNSDLYVVPRFSTAFVDPFAEIPTLCMLCSFFDKEGRPLASSPEQTLAKACDAFTASTGLVFEAMGELEYYVIAPATDAFPATNQRGYHESAPFAKLNDFRARCMAAIASAGGQIKYGHSEVGNFVVDGLSYEQNEIEFLPVPAREAADQLVIAKWIIRNMAWREGLDVTFAPKITAGKAGSGLHIHMRMTDSTGHNHMLAPSADGGYRLSDEGRRLIAGMMELAPSLTALGNTNPTSYFRLVPHQEAPTSICWGDRNRSVLVRVPLGWTSDTDMCAVANPVMTPARHHGHEKQTVEIRSADASANVYLLLAGLAVAARHGFEMGARALEIARDTYVDVDIHASSSAATLDRLGALPSSCVASADCMERQRGIYEAGGVFSPDALDDVIRRLRAYDDARLSAKAAADPALMQSLVREYFHCG